MDIEDLTITADIDSMGTVPGSVCSDTDEHGWRVLPVWYGDQSMGDDALSAGYLTSYEHAVGDDAVQRLDIVRYVVASNDPDYPYDVMEMSFAYRVVGCEAESPDDIDYRGCTDFAYETYEKALTVARNAAMCDERFKLASWQPTI